MSETSVHDLLDDAEGIGPATVERLEEHGIESARQVYETDTETLTGIPYVSEVRADELQTLADEAYTDPREVVLGAELGDYLSIDLAHRRGWANSRAVIATEEATEWQSAIGEDWHTRRIRIADSPTSDDRTEYGLVVGADGVYVTDEPAGSERWLVKSVEVAGSVQQSTLIRLQVAQNEIDAEADRPEGDDTWRQYHQRGEA